MNPTDLEFSVVICAYTEDRWDQLCDAVDSVHAQTTPPSRVVVVIDHNPGLLVRARSQFASDVVIENAGVQGLSDARNAGIASQRSATSSRSSTTMQQPIRSGSST